MKNFDEDKVSKIVAKLIKDTRSEVIEWSESIHNVQLGSEEELIGKAYETRLNNRNLRLYKFKYKIYVDIDRFGWSEGYRLEFIDNDGNSEWKFPSTNSLMDLYEAVTFQISEVDEFFNDYLSS